MRNRHEGHPMDHTPQGAYAKWKFFQSVLVRIQRAQAEFRDNPIPEDPVVDATLGVGSGTSEVGLITLPNETSSRPKWFNLREQIRRHPGKALILLSAGSVITAAVVSKEIRESMLRKKGEAKKAMRLAKKKKEAL